MTSTGPRAALIAEAVGVRQVMIVIPSAYSGARTSTPKMARTAPSP
jgi:hypothetical protein